ncbi:MAG: efflux RND transporter periplasmic adaptor subunit [Planctomycetota bacterium]
MQAEQAYPGARPEREQPAEGRARGGARRLDLKKYEEADFGQQKQTVEGEIAIAEGELKRAENQYEWTKKLRAKDYVTDTELKADELNVQKRKIDVDLAKTKQDVLIKYSDVRQRSVLKSAQDQAKAELERVEAQNTAQLAQAKADLEGKRATDKLEHDRLEKIRSQIAKATVRAPRDGLVVYATLQGDNMRGRQNPIEVGTAVSQRQLILSLPDISRMIADCKLHESVIDKVKEGQITHVTVDAMPDRIFAGTVSRVALLPSSQNMWLNPDLKVYATRIAIDGDTSMLKPGMSCSVQIIIDELKDVVSVPVHAVRRGGRKSYCYLADKDGTQLREVQIGLHNGKMIHIPKGLEVGDIVYLSVPPGAPELPNVGPEEPTEPVVDPASVAAGADGNHGKPDASKGESPSGRPSRRSRRGAPAADGEAAGDEAPRGGDAERMQEWRKKLESMTPEQREELRKKFAGSKPTQGP